MEACLRNGDLLRKIMAAIGDLVTDGNFDCTKNGMSLQAMDSSHVSLVSMILRADGFESWKCGTECQIGIHMEHMNKVLKCMGAKDELEFKYQEGSDEAEFVFKSPDEGKVSHFNVKLMEIEQDQLGIPETDYKASVRMSAAEFQRICRDMSILGDSLKISVRKDDVQFSINGEVGKGMMTLKSSTASDGLEEEVTDIDCVESVTQTFAMRYLNFFTKATGLSKAVKLSLSPDVPLMVEYAVDEIGFLRYYLAPKIDDDL